MGCGDKRSARQEDRNVCWIYKNKTIRNRRKAVESGAGAEIREKERKRKRKRKNGRKRT